MLVGDLDMRRARRDPAYLARIKAFLVRADDWAVAAREVPRGADQGQPAPAVSDSGQGRKSEPARNSHRGHGLRVAVGSTG